MTLSQETLSSKGSIEVITGSPFSRRDPHNTGENGDGRVPISTTFYDTGAGILSLKTLIPVLVL